MYVNECLSDRRIALIGELVAHVDVKVVSEILGHSQTAFTMDRYQHVTWDMQQEASRAVSTLLKTSAQK